MGIDTGHKRTSIRRGDSFLVKTSFPPGIVQLRQSYLVNGFRLNSNVTLVTYETTQLRSA